LNSRLQWQRKGGAQWLTPLPTKVDFGRAVVMVRVPLCRRPRRKPVLW
jgi:hypothetical protein